MSDILQFGEFELDLGAYLLKRGSKRIKLEKVPMEALILLVRKPDTLVERSEMEAALWGTVFVDRDSGINTAIRKIRHALGDTADAPTFIETVVGKGYRFIAPVRSLVPESERRRRRAFPSYCLTRGAQEFVLTKGENLIGRDPDARVHIDHASVSRRHARIVIRTGRVMLEDLKSRNGTFVDGRRVDTRMELRHGAIIGLGPITLTFVVLAGPASTKPVSVEA